MGLSIKNVSLRSFTVACRWASRKGFPKLISDWTPEQSDTLQAVCEEYDRRTSRRAALIVEMREIKDDAEK